MEKTFSKRDVILYAILSYFGGFLSPDAMRVVSEVARAVVGSV